MRYEWEERRIRKVASSVMGNALDGPNIAEIIEEMESLGFSLYHLRETDKEFTVLFRKVVDASLVRLWFVRYQNVVGGLFNVGPFSSREEASDAYLLMAKNSAIPPEYTRVDIIRIFVDGEKTGKVKEKGSRFSRIAGKQEVLDFGIGEIRRLDSLLGTKENIDFLSSEGSSLEREGIERVIDALNQVPLEYDSIGSLIAPYWRTLEGSGELGDYYGEDSLVGGLEDPFEGLDNLSSSDIGIDEDVFDVSTDTLDEPEDLGERIQMRNRIRPLA